MTEPIDPNPSKSGDQESVAPKGRVSREELDRLFDREMPADERRRFTGRLRHDPEALDEVLETRRMITQLRSPLQAPDLTDAVLSGVARRRGFLSTKLRRRVRTGRWAVAAMLTLALGTVAIAHRLYPTRLTLAPLATPVSDLGEAVHLDSTESGRRLQDAVMQMAEVRLVADADLDGPIATSVGPATLTVFHVEDAPVASGFSMVSYSEHHAPIIDLGVTDAETLALHHARATLIAYDRGHDLSAHSSDVEFVAYVGLTPDGSVIGTPLSADAYAFEHLTWSNHDWPGSDRTVSDWDVHARIAPGVLPLSASRTGAAAYVGSLDGFRDRTAEEAIRAATDRDRRHPDRSAPVIKDN